MTVKSSELIILMWWLSLSAATNPSKPHCSEHVEIICSLPGSFSFAIHFQQQESLPQLSILNIKSTKSEDYCSSIENKWIINCHGISLCSSHPCGISWSPWDLKQLMNTGCTVSAWTFWIIPHPILPIIPLLLKHTPKTRKLWYMWWWFISNNAPDVITCNFNGTLATIHSQHLLHWL